MSRFDFILKPRLVSAQATAAVVKLRQDNEYILESNRWVSFYINDEEITSKGFDNVKIKLADLQKVGMAQVMANTLDIGDNITLAAIVGREDLIGREIEEAIRIATDRIEVAIERINHYQGLIDGPGRFGPDLTFLHMEARNMWIGIRNHNIDLVNYFEGKVVEYYRIEAESAKLFQNSRDIRAAAGRGLNFIMQAASKLPDRFHSNALTTWRGDMEAEKNKMREKAFIIEVQERGMAFPRDWTEGDKIRFARRYLSEMDELKTLIRERFDITDFTISSSNLLEAQLIFYFLSDVDLAFWLTFEQRQELLAIIKEGDIGDLQPAADFIMDLSYGTDWQFNITDARWWAYQVHQTYNGAGRGFHYHEWLGEIAADPSQDGLLNISFNQSHMGSPKN